LAKSVSPRLQTLKVSDYRALREVAFKDLTPFTVLLGANGMGGLRKVECAAAISAHMDVSRNSSASFRQFRRGLELLVAGDR
jgi:predicted ATPase